MLGSGAQDWEHQEKPHWLHKKHEAPFQVTCVPIFPCCHHGHTQQTQCPHTETVTRNSGPQNQV